MAVEIVRVGEQRDQLGEGPLWDVAEQALYWVDSMGCLIHRYDPANGDLRDWPVPGMIGCMALRDGGGALIALQSGFHLFDFDTGITTPLADPEADEPRTRLNDGKTDRQGRFLCGSMGRTVRNPALGVLYRIDPDHQVTALHDGIGVSNGHCFAPDGRTFYFADSVAQNIHAWDYDPDSGAIANRRLFADLAPLESAPDGCTIDAEGRLWTAMVRSGQVGCFNPDGSLERRIDMPCQLPSSVMFGGPELDVLFVTSISTSENRQVNGPHDGGLFMLTGLDAVGLPEARFAG